VEVSEMDDRDRLRAGHAQPWVTRRLHRYDTYSEPLCAGMFLNVADGEVRSFGLEPLGELVLDTQHKVASVRDGLAPRSALAWDRVAGLLAVAAGVVAAATLAGKAVCGPRR